jgi:hypothetical protein
VNLPPTPVAVEDSKKGLSKFSVHEAVGDGVATGADVGKKLDERHAGAAYRAVHGIRIEHVPRVEHVQWCPTHKELCHNHKQHPDHLKPEACAKKGHNEASSRQPLVPY